MLVSLEVPFFRAFSVKGGFHGQGLAFAADLGVVYFHFRAGTQTDALLAAAVADEDEVLQYGVGNGSGGVVAAVVVALHQQSQS